MTAALLSACLLATIFAAGGTVVPVIDARHDEHLEKMAVSLSNEPPHEFVLSYHGPRIPFRGLICYLVPGYNETCMNPRMSWLTPAASISLPAPGGVPREFLSAYDVFVRFPSISERTFRYAQLNGSTRPEDSTAR